jgi:hypothetical protein
MTVSSGMTRERRCAAGLPVLDLPCMKLVDKIKSLFRRRPLTEEELAARAGAQTMSENEAMDIVAAEQRIGRP